MVGESHKIDDDIRERLIEWAATYNDPLYFSEDPIVFPRHFADRMNGGGASLQDVEIAAVIAAHLAWGRRSMIVRDCTRAMDEMEWRPFEYVMNGEYRDDDCSLHRTVKWSEFAGICAALKKFYGEDSFVARQDGRCGVAKTQGNTQRSLECLGVQDIRTTIYGRKADPNAPDKKINMLRRWMVRRDGKVDLGLWKDTSPESLIIPLDVHVYDEAFALGLTHRKQKNLRTAEEITDTFRDIFPGDPCLGDFALFGYGINKVRDKVQQ